MSIYLLPGIHQQAQNFLNAGTTLTEDLVSVWEMDETSGTTANDGYGSNDGTSSGLATGPTLGHTGISGTCYKFVSSDESLVTIPSDSTLRNYSTGAMSISTWIYLEDNGGSGYTGIAQSAGGSGYASGWTLFHNTSRLRFRWGTGSGYVGYIQQQSNYSLDNWYNVIVTWDGTYANIYVNNNLEETSASTSMGLDTYPDSKDMLIGYANGMNYSNNPIDQVAIWDKVLSSDERALIYGSGDGLAFSSF